ncbi:MAG: hypothetical protein J4G09_12135 [Proteobacteria bacterium]|nr:hypothetical protein [Pseudomonadota bacterium]
MSFLKTLLPASANNDFRGGRVPLAGFGLLIALTAFRSLVHLLKDDSGVNSIASIHLFPGDPDPNQVIYMYSSLWGGQQLILVVLYLIVLARYRNLIPLMFGLMALEVLLRLTTGILHPLTEEFYVRTPPGKLGNLPLLGASLLLLYLSHRGVAKSAGSSPQTAKT